MISYNIIYHLFVEVVAAFVSGCRYSEIIASVELMLIVCGRQIPYSVERTPNI